jgi:hypothetical protein
VKTIFIEEMGSLPNLPTSNSKKQNRSFRKSQPIWSDDLASLWRNTCQAEKAYTSFKVQSLADYATKNNLRIKFKNEQQKFDNNFRYFKRQDEKQQFTDLGNSALNKNKTDMWSTLKKLNNPPSSRAALEIVRADESISRDIKEILEKWHCDISKLFSGVKENPEIAFDDQFYTEIFHKKSEFEFLSFQEQINENIFSSEMLNSEITYIEVSDAINSIKTNKAYLEIPNEAMKNVNAKLLLHRFLSLCFSSGLNPTDWDYSDIKPIPKKGKDQRDPLQNH